MVTTSAWRVERAAARMTAEGGPLPVDELAADVGCGARQLQRDFESLLGVSPRQYGQAVRTRRATQSLRDSETVSEAIYDAGYGSVRAFYEEAGRRLGLPASVVVAGCVDQLLLWSAAPTEVGDVLAVAAPLGLAFVRIGEISELERQMAEEFPRARLVRDDAAMVDVMAALTSLAVGRSAPSLPIDVQGTAFQARVWDALRRIPRGETRTYAGLAEDLGEPRAVRAVARACATNRVALAIPCHRVIRSDGSLAGYRWGLEVKRSLLAAESMPT